MATTVAMLSPDGTSGEIPIANQQAALQAGFKPAVRMQSPDGTPGYIPVDRVQDATKAGFKTAQGTGASFLDDLQNQLRSNGPMGQGTPTQEFLKGGASEVLNTIRHPVQAAEQMGQAVQASGVSPGGMYPATASLGPGPTGQQSDALNQQAQQRAQNNFAQQGQFARQHPAYAAGGAILPALATAGVAKGIEAAAPVVTDAMSAAADLPEAAASKNIPGQNYSPAHAQAFEGAIAPANAMGKNFIPQNVSPQALTPIRATAARMMNGNPLEQATVRAAVSPSTPPLQRLQAYQGVVQTSLNDLEQLHSSALQSAADVPVDTNSLVQGLKSHISATTDPADAAAIRGLIQRTQQVKTLDDLNTFRQELNNETSPEYRQSQIQAGRSGTSVQAASDLAGDVRSAYYDQLGDATGVNYAPLKMRESNLLTTLESLQNQRPVLAKAEATFNAPSTLKETAGNIAGIIQNPRAGVTQTLLRESPAFRVSNLLQKSLADLPVSPNSPLQLGRGAITMPPPNGGPNPLSTPQAVAGTTRAQRLGLLLKPPPIELPGAVQQNIPAYSPDTAAARMGRLLPAHSATPIQLPERNYPALDPSSFEQLMQLRNGGQ